MTSPRRRSTGRGRALSRSAGPVASLVWRGIASTNITALAIGAQTVVEVLDQTIDDIAHGTIMRILGNLTMRAAAANLQIFFRAGLIVVTDDALVAGAVPEPWADPAPWMWEDTGLFETDSANDGSQYHRLVIDVRVKRRMPQAEHSLVMVLENLAASGTGLDFHLNLKALVRVP